MADLEQLKILKQGVEAWNKWREEKPNLIEPYLRVAFLSGTDLSRANLSRANLGFADLSAANLIGADLSRANLSRANLSRANLIGANLGFADLSGADFSGANLGGANLSSAHFSGTDLSRANLSRADLNEAVLIETNFSGANLSRANLIGANLLGSILLGANVNKANLSSAFITNFTIGDVDLSNVSGLESTIHHGPSTIGIDTIFRSDGKIPHKFLKDVGVPDIFIEYMGSLTGQAFQFYSCFISHSTNDKEFAERIYADLRKEGVRCWFAPEDIKGGEKIHRQLDEAIRIHDKTLLILSENSIYSDWVANEIRWARKREKQEGKQKLFPLSLIDYEKLKKWELFDPDTATDLAVEVRSYFIPDFTNWKDHNNYSTAFKRLLRDLQTKEK